MTGNVLKIAVIAGEVSGDILGADAIAAIRQAGRAVELIGVGGDRLQAEGLTSLFDYSELSLMGFTEVIGKLPRLLRRIRQTADAIIAAKPDILFIIDSPDFTHRVARRVRKALPSLPVVQYVCPSVWAWKEYRAVAMTSYVDLVLAILPFEPDVMKRLGGPKTVYVGHRLATDENILEARRTNLLHRDGGRQTILLLPGSRSSEITRLGPVMGAVVAEISSRNPGTRFLLPAVSRRKDLIATEVAKWSVQPEWADGDEFKWKAFGQADAAIAASGTVILELAMAGIPAVSIYKTDILIRMIMSRIKTWSAALPNLIADYTVVPEYINDMLKPGVVVRWAERLLSASPQRSAMMSGYEDIWRKMSTPEPSGQTAAREILALVDEKKAGS
jgi:lipid-A-disaccharide synthase